MQHAPINIYEYRVGNAPEGFWRYVYDPYATGKPVDDASEDRGRAVFAAFRTNAPGTIPIHRHHYTYDEPHDPKYYYNYTTADERTPSSYELDDQPSGSDHGGPSGTVEPFNYPWPVSYEQSVARRSDGSRRAFWAYPASSGGSIAGAVPVYEHRLEVDFMGEDRSVLSPVRTVPRLFLLGRCLAYLKYSTSENAGSVFDTRQDARTLSAPSADWWRVVTEGPASPGGYRPDIAFAYARYTRKIAFYAFPAQ